MDPQSGNQGQFFRTTSFANANPLLIQALMTEPGLQGSGVPAQNQSPCVGGNAPPTHALEGAYRSTITLKALA